MRLPPLFRPCQFLFVIGHGNVFVDLHITKTPLERSFETVCNWAKWHIARHEESEMPLRMVYSWFVVE